MANEAEQAIYQRLASAPLFHPASVELLPEDWGIETGDVVSVKSGNETYNVPVYSHTLVWNGKSKATIESTGHEQREPLPELKRKEYQQGHAMYSGFRAQQQEIDEHYKHVVEVTDQGMSDAFGILGVSIGADGMPAKDSSGNYIWDDSGTGGAIWGHLNRNAWTSVIQNHIQDANGNILSIAKVLTNADGQALIQAINDQRTGTATINANRIKLSATDSITLDARLAIEASTGFLLVTGSMAVQDDLRVSDTLRIGGSGSSQGEESGALYFQGNAYEAKQLILGNRSPFIASGRVLANFVSDSINLNHTHSVTMEEITSSSDPNAGHVKITMGGAVAENDSSRIDFFDIAASQTYLNGVAAAYGNAVGRVVWPNTPRSQSSCSISVPTNPWNASQKTGTTESRIFTLRNDGQFDDATHITTVNLEMSHSAGGQTVLDGVVATIAIDASAVYTEGQGDAPIQGQVTKTYTSNGWKSVIYPDEGYSGISAVQIHVDVPIPEPPAYASSGWGITSAAGGGTKVELYVDGHYFSHTFNDYP